MSLIYVGGYGPSNAKLAIVGEAPGRNEEDQLRPFVGQSGRLARECIHEAGLDPEEVYWTNVVKHRPPNNDINLLHVIGKKVQDYLPQLWDEINALKPNAILAFGNTALEALTGYRGIDSYRGSILSAQRANTKVVSTIHPAALLRGEGQDGGLHSWKDLTYVKWDVKRAVEQSRFPGINRKHRNLIICRSNLDLYRFLNRYQSHTKVSVDIETFNTIPSCISFAFSSSEAISVPLFPIKGWMSRSDQLQCWKDVAEILHDTKIQKIGQNFKFDEPLLSRARDGRTHIGLDVQSFFFDTLLAFRTLYPELPGSLEFQTSVLTDEPYYKEEGKGYNPSRDKLDRLLLYNAKDAVVTYECYERELEELKARNLEDFFFTKVMPLHPFYSRIEGRGILRNEVAAKELKVVYSARLEAKEAQLFEETKKYGIEEQVNCNSPKQVASLLYDVMKLPVRAGTAEKVLNALMRNAVKDEGKRRIIRDILEIRKIRKTIGTYINAKCHPDGRLRTGYRIMLETGRTSTSVLDRPVTTEKLGLAFQTITKHGETGADLRSLFIPDRGYILIEPDLSQAEARVVAVLARDGKLLKMFEFGVDVHLVTYGWMENLIPDVLLENFFLESDPILARALALDLNAKMRAVINDEQRQVGKKSRHAGHYDMGKQEAASQLGVSEYQAGKFLDKFHKRNENIRGVFHKDIQDSLRENNRILRNPFGRERQFLNRWGNELFKEAYAQIPQSTVSDHLKFAAQRIEKRCPWMQILQESHDSFLAQIEPIYDEMTFKVIREELETPINFKNCTLSRDVDLVIPCDIAMSDKTWLEMKKVKL